MSGAGTFTVVNDKTLCEAIDATEQSLVYVAPLVSILEQDLATCFGSCAEVFKPELRWVFKDVTYESISDRQFRDALSKALRDSGGERLVAQLFSEHDAAPEVVA